MNMFQKVYYFFSQYAGPEERRVGSLLQQVTERDSVAKRTQQLEAMLQRDAAVTNIWSEHRYKNYQYLTKKKRRELYANLALIHDDFTAFYNMNTPSRDQVLNALQQLGIDPSLAASHVEQFSYMMAIMHYAAPQRGRYIYRASSSFGRLLHNPASEQLEGDCNQIVTLYTELYAKKFPIGDISLVVFPGHVAIRFFGVDIEATNGRFTRYDKPDQSIVPITELVSINLLDTTDSHFATARVTPEAFLESARLAYVLSSHRKIVKKNLEVAYQKMVHHLMQHQQFPRALSYAKQSKDYELIQAVAHNGTVHELTNKNYKAARRFASQSERRQELLKTINNHEAVQLFNTHQYEAARKLYDHIGDSEMVLRCYRALFSEEQQKLGKIETADDVKAQAKTVRRMERYAKLSQDASLISYAKSISKYL